MVVTKLAKKIGVDKAIAYSSGGKIFQALSGVITIFLISFCLSDIEQGFYYTFGSLVATQVFFELGLTDIITQYVAHEASHLEWVSPTSLDGDQYYKSRLAYLLKFSLKWYSIIGLLLFVVLLISGYLFFSEYSDNTDKINWFIPWILVCIGTVLNLLTSPLLAIINGLNKVKEVARIRFYQQILVPFVTCCGLFLGAKLYVLGISLLSSIALVYAFFYFSSLKGIVFNLWNVKITSRVNYMREIFPYQWKIALSWIGGYFTFQLFNPVLFATEGAIVAGQMGMTLQVLNSISSFSLSWINTKIPTFCNLISLKNYIKLDAIFNKTLKQVAIVSSFLVLIFFLVLLFLKKTELIIANYTIADRFLGLIPTILMAVPVIINLYVNAWATYLRCHKQEPFLINSISTGALCCLSTFILGNCYGLYGMVIGYFILKIFVSLPWSYLIYKHKREQWHKI